MTAPRATLEAHPEKHGWSTRHLLAALLLSLSACSSPAPRPVPAAEQFASIYVIDRGWHTDLGFSVTDLHGPLARLAADFPGARFLIFGFGDRHYVLAKDKNFGEMLAALWPGPGLILVTGLSADPGRAFGADHNARIRVTPAQADAAAAYVWRSIAADAAGLAHPYAPGPYGGSLFYLSTTTYSGWHTCNSWTAEGLRAAGQPVLSTGVLFAGQVWDQAEELASGIP
jgi:hypothetical protein